MKCAHEPCSATLSKEQANEERGYFKWMGKLFCSLECALHAWHAQQ
jgi:hypothetical protein